LIFFLGFLTYFCNTTLWDNSKIRVTAFDFEQLLPSFNTHFSRSNTKNSILHSNNLLADIFIPLVFFILFSFFLLSAFDLFSAYLALEGVSLALYTLTANTYNKRVSIEAAIKYFVFGGVSNGLLIFGNSIFFGVCGTLNYLNVNYILSILSINISSITLYLGIICFLIVFWFKIAAFPCYMWSPDVYEGTWLPITAILIIVVKLLYFLFFFKIFYYVFFSLSYVWQPLFLLSSLGSLIVGSFGIIGQNRIKRFMAYSSINHISFILLGMSCASLSSLTVSILYLLVYSFTLLFFFGILLRLRCMITGRFLIYLSDFANLPKFSPISANMLLIVLFSMGGIPPLAGFFIKLYVYIEAISSGLHIFVIISLIITIVSMFYYLFFLKSLFFDKNLWSKLVYAQSSHNLLYALFLFFCTLIIFFIFSYTFFFDISKKLALCAIMPIKYGLIIKI